MANRKANANGLTDLKAAPTNKKSQNMVAFAGLNILYDVMTIVRVVTGQSATIELLTEGKLENCNDSETVIKSRQRYDRQTENHTHQSVTTNTNKRWFCSHLPKAVQ